MPEASIHRETPRKGRFSWPRLFAALGALAFLASWWAPNHYPPWLSIHNEGPMFLALGLGAMALLGSRRTFVLDPLPWLVAALILLVWLQWGAGQIAYHGDAALSSLYLAGMALAWWLGRNALQDPAPAERLLVWLAGLTVAAAAVSVYVALLQWLGLEAGHDNLVLELKPGGRPYANLAQPNHLATLLLMATAMSMLLRAQGRLRGWLFWAVLVWLGFGLTMAQSRASWLSAFAMGLALLWWRRTAWTPAAVRTVAAWWSLLLAMGLLWKPANELLLLSSARAGGAAIAQDPTRLLMWRQLWAGVEQSPWWGYGWRQTVVGQKAGAAQLQGAAITDYAHSLVLDLVLWVGLPLGLLLMALAAGWLLRVARRINHPTQLLLLCAALPVLVHSLVEFPFAYAYFLFPTALILGALHSLQDAGRVAPARACLRTGRTAPALVLALYTGVCLWATRDYVVAEDDFRVMRFEMRKVGQRPEGHEVPDLRLLNQLGEMLQLGRITPTPGMPSQDMERMRIASEATMWATIQMRYAVALALNGKPEEAAQQLHQIREYYGEISYRQARELFLNLRDTEYPQLGAVQLP